MIDPLDYDRSIMELQLKKQKLEEEIADIDNVLKWMNEQKQELLKIGRAHVRTPVTA